MQENDLLRIAKYLAYAGLGSRRNAEELIAKGLVRINNIPVLHPATFVGAQDRVTVGGKVVKCAMETHLWLYHKPRGLVVSHADPTGKPTVFDHLQEQDKNLPRLVSVGRLDMQSEGLLLLTNQGWLAHRLEHPSQGWRRRYRVRIFGRLSEAHRQLLAEGPTIEGVHYAPVIVTPDGKALQEGANQWVIVTLTEGKNREIRRIFNHLGYKVNRLIRMSYGPFQLGNIPRDGIRKVPRKMMEEQLGSLLIE
jgi:23S rRNA pseudouridine2605 synthase